MAKKFLNLDNMNLLWDSIDRNFIRKEDIPYTEFEELILDNKTIIGAINEIYNMIYNGGGPVVPPPTIESSITLDPSSLNFYPNGGTKTFTAVYKNVISINAAKCDDNWISISESTSDNTITYTVIVSPNSGNPRNSSINISAIAHDGSLISKSCSISQQSYSDASIADEGIPRNIEYTGYSGTHNVFYDNFKTINQPISSASWLSINVVEENSGNISYSITADQNNGESRSATLTFSCVGLNGNEVNHNVEIMQSAAPVVSITVNPTILELNWDSYESTLKVTYNNYIKDSVLKPIVHNDWIGEVIEKYAAGDTYTYDIKNISQNKSSTLREGIITFMCKGLLGNDFTKLFTITQGAAPSGSLTVDPISKTISADGGQITFTITFNNSEYYWVTNDNDWITIPTTGNSSTGGSTSPTYTITVSKNTGEERKGTIYFYCHGHDGADIPVEVTITQEAAKKESFMYIGYIPRNDMSSFAEITSDMILNGVSKGEIVKSDAKSVTADYTGFGDVPAKSFLLIALLQSSGLKATKWNIIEQDCPFSVNPMSNGDTNITIDEEQYQLYGEYTKYELIKNSEEVYYKIK